MEATKLIPELEFKAIRSSGSGGQHANKVSSKVELHFNLLNSEALSDSQKKILLVSLGKRLTNNNELILQCDESRSQHKNKELIIKRFIKLIEQGLIVQKKRVPTKTPKAVIRKRLDNKKKQSIKKITRKKPEIE